MTCYFRHIQGVLEKAGVALTTTNKREVDRVIHKLVHVKYKNCPRAWREVKKRIADNEKDFVYQLRQALEKQA